MTYSQEVQDDGKIALWFTTPTSKTLVEVFDNQVELDKKQEGIRKLEERGRALTHTGKKRPHESR